MVASRRAALLAMITSFAHIGCSGLLVDTTNGDGGEHDAQVDGSSSIGDAGPADAVVNADAYLACMTATGKIDESIKVCDADTDCRIMGQRLDCCGTMLYAGVNRAAQTKFAFCESAWLAHFTACGCDASPITTEDGKESRYRTDGGPPHVHCIDTAPGGGLCMTYTP